MCLCRQIIVSLVLFPGAIVTTLADSHPSPATVGREASQGELGICSRDRKPNFNYDSGTFYSQASPMEGYDTGLRAVIAASNRFNPRSIEEDREYIGVIYRYCRRYYYTVTAGQQGEDVITARVQFPRQATVVAFWHTHGAAAREHKYFSDIDMLLVRRWLIPFYLSDYTGELKVLTPRDNILSSYAARNLGLPVKYGFARGSVVKDRSGQTILINT